MICMVQWAKLVVFSLDVAFRPQIRHDSVHGHLPIREFFDAQVKKNNDLAQDVRVNR